MKTVDELIYEAIVADESLMTTIGERVTSTCFEIPPDQLDNTEVPNIIITDKSGKIIDRYVSLL